MSLQLTIPSQELFDEENEKYIDIDEREVTLSHTLVTASKWESKFKRAFISDVPMSPDETLEYIVFWIF